MSGILLSAPKGACTTNLPALIRAVSPFIKAPHIIGFLLLFTGIVAVLVVAPSKVHHYWFSGE